ncbi:MAG: sugar transferase, partial [Verrucomicrobiota bacterium]
MLHRDRQIRRQTQQLVDAVLFAFSFWLAYQLRANPAIRDLFHLEPVHPFDSYSLIYLVLIPVAPLILELQGFYRRPFACGPRTTAWLLFKGCVVMGLVLILSLFLFRMLIARWVVFWFSFISFGVVFLKEELLRWAIRSKVAQAQYRRRVILVGIGPETDRMLAELKAKAADEVEVLATLDLDDGLVGRLVDLLHEHSVNGVILIAKHAYFGQVEEAIRACEIEGVEAWLVADFFRTQISRTSFDD